MANVFFFVRGAILKFVILGTFTGSIFSPIIEAKNSCYQCAGRESCKFPKLVDCDWQWAACWQYLNHKNEVEHARCVAQPGKIDDKNPCQAEGQEYSCFCQGDRCNRINLKTGKEVFKQCYTCDGKEKCKKPQLVECSNPDSSCWQLVDIFHSNDEVMHLECMEPNVNRSKITHCETNSEGISCHCYQDRCNGKDQGTGKKLF